MDMKIQINRYKLILCVAIAFVVTLCYIDNCYINAVAIPFGFSLLALWAVYVEEHMNDKESKTYDKIVDFFNED